MMLRDVLNTLTDSDVVEGITIISSDSSLIDLAKEYKVECIVTELDSGYSEDAEKAIESLRSEEFKTIAIIPGDVPLLSSEQLTTLNKLHNEGITLCPAKVDGGTNTLVFSMPQKMPLLFGVNSLERYRKKAVELGIPCQVLQITGLERDIDRPEDISWLLQQECDNNTSQYLRTLNITTLTK